MGWENSNPYEYHPERGLYYHEVARNLICGSQPQTREDIEHLHNKESVTNLVNLQVRCCKLSRRMNRHLYAFLRASDMAPKKASLRLRTGCSI